MTKPLKSILAGGGLLALSVALSLLAGLSFWSMHRPEPLYPGPGLTGRRMLSDYFSGLKNTKGDTGVFVFEGKEPGGTMLLLGGTHPNEPGGFVTAVVLLENITVRRGRVLIVPRANSSAFTHSDPQEAAPQRFFLATPGGGRRWFRYGSRFTNPVDQWPDPTLYINPAGQMLAGAEVRNLNRCYPGRPHGYLTEKMAFGIMELIRREKVDLGLDLHESAPEYPVINAMVFHEQSADLAALAKLELEAAGFDIRLEASPPTLRGLSHREWGDYAGIHSVLVETANASQGRLKGKPTPDLVVEGRDKFYLRAAGLGRLFVPFGPEGIPMRVRVARHLATIRALVSSFSSLYPDKKILIENMPDPSEVQKKDVGFFLGRPRKDG
jgi:hypothetical protein